MSGKFLSLNKFIRSCLIALICLYFIGCSSAPALDINKWHIEADASQETLTINHTDLGILLKEAKLFYSQNDKLTAFSDWSVKSKADTLTISTQGEKESTWILTVGEDTINITCTAENTYIQGTAPASKDRIPARTENQDNDIMYTALGQVTAANIYCLFDRNTDTMIQFPKTSKLKRSPADHDLMEVTIPVTDESAVTLMLDYYINVLGLKFYKPIPQRFENAPIAWSSWYCYYMGTTEEDVMKETDALAEHLKPYGLEYIQLDACFTRGKDANYLDWTKKTFPHGGKWLFEYISSKGLKPALWVNIYGSNYAKAECADKYPENFYLKDKNGELSGACCTADKTVVRLDYSNPEVIEKHLKPMFTVLKEDWGLKYIKDAGWGTWMDYYEKNKENAFDPTRESRDLYLDAQKALRETLGPDIYIGGCAMHEVGLGFGIYDGSRIGGDDKAIWYPEKEGGMSMQIYFHSLFGGNYLNNITWHCDPDAAMLRNPLTLEEGRTVVTAIALTGQLYMASDFMNKLSRKKLELYQKTMPTTHIVPIDLYSYKLKSEKKDGVIWCCPQVEEFPRAVDLKVNSEAGIYDVAALFNWEDEAGINTILLKDDLGLDTDKEYLIFDFWSQKLKEITHDVVTTSIPAHGTRVFIIKPVLPRPQLVATSRHITCAVSLKKLNWDSEQEVLSGSSEVIPGDDYSLFIHVPKDKTASDIKAGTEILYSQLTGSILEVKLSGQIDAESDNVVEWSVKFGSSQ
jgi:hypothetical protein